MSPKGTRTEENLKLAFTREAEANRRYLQAYRRDGRMLEVVEEVAVAGSGGVRQRRRSSPHPHSTGGSGARRSLHLSVHSPNTKLNRTPSVGSGVMLKPTCSSPPSSNSISSQVGRLARRSSGRCESTAGRIGRSRPRS